MQRLRLLGGLSIESDEGPVTGRAAQRRRLALLALLAVARGGLSRDKLVAHLWPDASAENGRSFLSDSVYRINHALGGEVIVAAGETLRLDPARLPSDATEFEDAVAAGASERAAALYGGPFADGFALPDAPELMLWIESERERLNRMYAEVLEMLAIDAARRGDWRLSVSWWKRLAALDPYNSRVALRLMEALDSAGESAAAIQHARVHETLLREELEMEGDPAVRELADALREGRRPRPRPVTAESTAPTPGSSPGVPATPPPIVGAGQTPAEAGLVTGSAADGDTSAKRSSWKAGVPFLIAMLIVIAIAAAGIWRGIRGAATAADAPRSVAVLPFASLTQDPADEYFSDGITEELIATLGRVDGLRVASRTSAFAFKNRPIDVREVGRRLGVDAVIEGSVRKAGDTLRISAQLVSTQTGYTLWSNVYDRQPHDLFAIQEEIARAMVGTLRGTEAASAETPLAPSPPRDPEAYDLYLKGRYSWHRRTREGLLSAIEQFERSIALEPDYARAHVGLADAYAVGAFYDYLAPREAYPRAEAAARRALELEPALAAPHATLGYILTYYHLDWPAAERSFRRALSLDPAYSTAHQWYANLLTVSARFDDAEREMRAAQETDPLSLIANAALGWTLYFAGDYEQALEQCRRTLALDADYQLAHLWGGWALEALGRRDEAHQWIGRAAMLSDGSVLTRLALAHLLAGSSSTTGRDSALAIVRDVERRAARGDYVPSYEIGKVHLALGNRPVALDWLERAAAERSHSMAYLRVDPQLAPLRGDARFERLVARTRRSIDGRD